MQSINIRRLSPTQQIEKIEEIKNSVIEQKRQDKAKEIIDDFLLCLGFDEKKDGFQYLAECIYRQMYDLQSNFVRFIYPLVAKKFDSNESTLKRVMDYSIRKWAQAPKTELAKIVFGNSDKLTVKNVIAKSASYLNYIGEENTE